MKKKISMINPLIILVFGFITFSCMSDNDDPAPVADNEPEVDSFTFPKNERLDQISGLLAGSNSDAFLSVFSDSLHFWKDYKKEVDSCWALLSTERLSKMDKWSREEISPKIVDTTLLLYPFSGPDFLNAFHLFPNANDYILIAKEKLGSIPDLYSLSESELKNYLDAINFSLRDIYSRSYFITLNMDQDLRKKKVDGILPVLYLFLNRTGHEIYDFSYYRLEDDSKTFTQISKPSNSLNKTECIEFLIRKDGDNKLKKLKYFYADISDEGFDANPILLEYLNNTRRCNSFLKSAAYLSHYGSFSKIRNLILDKSDAVLEDDTGVPFRYFKDDKWDCFLYGNYSKPIEDFQSRYLFQKDLDHEYKTSDNVVPLDFSLGYHWRSSDQNWALYVKKNFDNYSLQGEIDVDVD